VAAQSITALRFVVSGGGTYTTSNAEAMVMEPGDLLIQPNWAWHDHVNDSQEPIVMTGLDREEGEYLVCLAISAGVPRL
jgi:gentisate 1,2-dioxygenase